MNEVVEGYKKAVDLLSSASRGLFTQPAISSSNLLEAYDTIDGLDTSAIRSAGQRASGGTDTGGVQSWVGEILKYLGGIAGGIIATELFDRATDWLSNRGGAEEVGEASGKAADAIDTAVDESDQGMQEIIAQLIGIIEQLTATLSTIDSNEHPQAFADCVAAGADLIDQAGAMVCDLCADRDEAISQCLNALTNHAKKVCESPIAPLKDAVSGAHTETSAASGGSSAGSGSSGGGGAGVSGGGEAASPLSNSGSESKAEVSNPGNEKTTPATAEKNTEVQETAESKTEKVEKSCEEQPKKLEEKPEPAAKEDCAEVCDEAPPTKEEPCVEEPAKVPADEPEAPEEPEVPKEPETSAEPEKESGGGMKTFLGVIGIGALVLGIGALVTFIEQAVVAAAEVPLPAVETEPAAPPAQAAPPEPAKITEEQLASVPEPAPKPIPTASATAIPAPAPVTTPAPAAPATPAAPAAAFVANPQSEQLVGASTASTPAPKVNVRKAGGW
ncbi:hypothetical protein SFC07_03950 [Corynebacterium callunae]|uniref:hypothetical protein n=1 Tax=Corynebacterium callunae TaxID=1721 RepID=UPI003981FBB1